MKKRLLLPLLTLLAPLAQAQITITAADMPVWKDTLRYSAAAAATSNLNLTNTGANITWNYSSLVPVIQGVDTYKKVTEVNIAYAATIGNVNAIGYKVADTLSLPGAPVSATNAYTFFSVKSNPSRFVAEGFGAVIAGLPTPAAYSDEDEWYFFPLAYGNAQDSTTFKLSASLLGIGSLKQQGYRKTKVDGWGTITTPYFTTPVQCLRVRTEVVEIDSISIPGQNLAFPRQTFEYKWLVAGEHYPALWVSGNIVAGNEVPTTVRYRDSKRLGLGVAGTAPKVQVLQTWPNPASEGILHLAVPAAWTQFTVEVYDMQGRRVAVQEDQKELDIRQLAHGQYLLRVAAADGTGYARIVR